MARKLEIVVTYDAVTEDSATEGDVSDHGWIAPGTEERRSLRKGGRRMYDRNVRMAQANRFNWPSVRAALAYIEDNVSGYWDCLTNDERDGLAHLGKHYVSARKLSDGYDIECGRNGYEHGESVSLQLHVTGLSRGSLARLSRALLARGVGK